MAQRVPSEERRVAAPWHRDPPSAASGPPPSLNSEGSSLFRGSSLFSKRQQTDSCACCPYVPPLSPHDREYAVAVTLSPRELRDLLPPSLLGSAALRHPRSSTLRGPLVRIWVAQRPIYGMLFRCSAVPMGVSSAPVLREEASSSRRSFEDPVLLPLAPHSHSSTRAHLARASLHRLLTGLARRGRAKAALGFIAAKPAGGGLLPCGVSHI